MQGKRTIYKTSTLGTIKPFQIFLHLTPIRSPEWLTFKYELLKIDPSVKIRALGRPSYKKFNVSVLTQPLARGFTVLLLCDPKNSRHILQYLFRESVSNTLNYNLTPLFGKAGSWISFYDLKNLSVLEGVQTKPVLVLHRVLVSFNTKLQGSLWFLLRVLRANNEN